MTCGEPLQSAAPKSRCRRLSRSALAGAVLLGGMLGGCASQIADMPVVGLPANTPARPATPAEYLPVHDLPAPRPEAVLDPAQQDKLQKELTTGVRQISGAQPPAAQIAEYGVRAPEDAKKTRLARKAAKISLRAPLACESA